MPAKVSELLQLPEKVVPVAGLCLGWPADEGGITPRLSLATTVHYERFDEGDLGAQIDAYDRRRARARPYRNQRDPARFGRAEFYGWSEDKARQYAVRCAPTSAHSCARRAFISTEAIL